MRLCAEFLLPAPPPPPMLHTFRLVGCNDHPQSTQNPEPACMLAGRLAAPTARLALAAAQGRRPQHVRLKLISGSGFCAAPHPGFCPLAAAPCAPPPGPAAAPRQSKTAARPWRCLAVQQLSAEAGQAAAGAGAAAQRSIGPGEVHLWWLDPQKVGAGIVAFGAAQSG